MLKKNLILLIAALAMTGLSACHESAFIYENGDKRCANNAIEIYNNGSWEILTLCEDSSVCNERTHVCDAVCAEGDRRCKNNAVEICMDKLWTFKEACADKSCSDDSYTCVATNCQTGWERCHGNIIERCDKHGVYKAITPAACSADTYCLGLLDHTATCVECVLATDCIDPTTHLCKENKCVVIPECIEDFTKCEANVVMVCVEGAWKIDTTCDDTEYCSTDDYTCQSDCLEGSSKCTADGQINLCSDNVWTASDCDDGDVCPVGKTACEPIVCEEGSRVCNDTQNVTIACVDNVIVEVACTGDTALCEAGACVACLNGEKRCEGNAVEVCVDNAWTVETACGAKTCHEDTNTCEAAACTAGWQRCNGNVIEECSTAGVYEAVSPAKCATGLVCLDAGVGTHTASCVQCKTATDCASVTAAPICHSDNTCVACVAGDSKCEENVHMACKDGSWDSVDCGIETLHCHPTAMCVACTQNTHCTDSETPVCNTTTYECKAASGDLWHFTQDFEGFEPNTSYSTEQTIVAGDVTTTVFSSIRREGSIDGNSAVFSDKTDASITMSLAATAHLGTLSFEYKSWASDDFSMVGNRKIEIYVDDATTPIETIVLSGVIVPLQTATIIVNQNVKSIKIERIADGIGKAKPRLVIDNIKLTN